MLRWMPATTSAWLAPRYVAHHRAPVAALRAEARVAEAAHQLGPQRRDALRVHARRARVVGEAVAGHRRRRRRRRRRPDRRRARAGSVSGPMIFANSATEPGQPCVMTSGNGFGPVAAHVDEVDAEVADACAELRERVQRRLGRAPVVALAPVGDQLAQVREVGAVGPARVRRSRRGSACARGARADRSSTASGTAMRKGSTCMRAFYASAKAAGNPFRPIRE